MSDRGIIFSAPMVRALMEGRKTQTRRILKVPGIMGGRYPIYPPEDAIELEDGEFARGIFHYRSTGALSGPYRLPAAVGDRLYVRETWACHFATDDQKPREIAPDLWSVRYFADDHIRPAGRDGSVARQEQCRKKRPAIFLPRWASRLTLIVEAVKVEPLQAISEADAKAEGAAELYGEAFDPTSAPTNRRRYELLWRHLHGADSWDANPTVIALTFRVEHANIDAIHTPSQPTGMKPEIVGERVGR